MLNPPNVFGWTAYYQTGYYQQWINSTTLGLRGFFTDSLTNGTAKFNGKAFDPLPYVKTLMNPGDPVQLVDQITSDLLAVSLSAAQKTFLIDTVLLDNLPRYEWTVEWNTYTSNPSDATKMKAVQLKLTAFFQYLFRMAEYQVC